MARKKIKYNSPDGLFIQHADQIKLLFKSKKQSKTKQIICGITNGFYYFLKIFDNAIEQEFISKIEKLNLEKIIQKVGYIYASSDRLFLPDISVRLNNEIENILNTFISHENLLNPEISTIKKEDICSQEIEKINIPDSSLFKNLSILIKEFYKDILSILNSNFILCLTAQSIDINTIITTKSKKQDKSNSITLINITIHPKDNPNTNIYNKTIVIEKLISEICKNDFLKHDIIFDVKNTLNLLTEKNKKISSKKNIKKINIEGVLFDTITSFYLISCLQNTTIFTPTDSYLENLIMSKRSYLNELETKEKIFIDIKIKKQKNTSSLLDNVKIAPYEYIISLLTERNITNFLYIQGLTNNELNLTIQNYQSNIITVMPLLGHIIKKGDLEFINIDLLELSKDLNNVYMFKLNIISDPLLFFTKEAIINIM